MKKNGFPFKCVVLLVDCLLHFFFLCAGLDLAKHGERAYPPATYGDGWTWEDDKNKHTAGVGIYGITYGRLLSVDYIFTLNIHTS